ncbi:ATP-binding protein [Geomonas sp. RF6]|uniref:sensor histidine kinase n=1 Tax=Geomonas sp. RF6 TaxID=2897342 RepID=UPI001E5EE492|nr:ATP-binding protein [Geomonas sp. RF6]UFS69995.1 ATP-binding protein [Geomonas sp. RF6]
MIELQLAHEELCKTNASLEQAVSERTRELSLTVEDLKREVAQRTKLALDLQVETAERLRVQVELREKDLMLMQQSRLAAMGEMIGNIAHQWRQPLNRLGLLAQDVLLTHEAGGADGTYLEDHVKKTMETIHHMSQTIEDFRNFFRPDKEKTRFDGVDAIETTLSLLEEGLKSQHVITEIDRSGDAFVFGFPNEYKQVLINIVANARDAFAERKTPHPHIRFTAWSEEGTSYVTVSDNAGGIPEEIIDRLFEPYFTTKEPDKGTGLGLYMSRMIIERNMGGRLTARNIVGGAEFIIATPSTG